MTLSQGWLRDHADDVEPFTGWVDGQFWYNDMILDPVPGYDPGTKIEDIRGCCR